ncbi:MAG: F0F1 ATP synthase subunit B' [Hyphomonadaceae bacterium]
MAAEPLSATAEATHSADAAAHGAEAAAHGAAHGAEHGSGVFPPFDATTFSSQLVWFAITFGVLYYVLSRFVLPKVGAVIERRESTVKADLDLAAQESEAAETARQEAERTSANARAEARKTVEDMRAKTLAAFAAEQEKADADVAARIAAEEGKVSEMREKALSQVEALSADLANDIVKQLTGASVAKAQVRA